MLWSLGFIVTFTIGGMTGVLLAVPPADFLLHNSLFLVAHFHNVIIGGVVFAAFAGVTYWFPKAFGFRLHEGWGKAAFWLSLVGFYVVFVPLYAAGLLGMTRRLQNYDVAAWHPWLLAAGFGIMIMVAAAACQVIQFVVSIRHRDELRDMSGRPVGRPLAGMGDRLAAAAPSTSRCCRNVHGEEPYWEIKRRAIETQQLAEEPDYQPIEMPRNSPTGFITAFFATITGFALIWHIWWLVGLGIAAAYVVFVWFAWRDVEEYAIPAEEVAQHRPRAPADPPGMAGRNTPAISGAGMSRADALPQARQTAISTPTGLGEPIVAAAMTAAATITRPVTAKAALRPSA